VVFLAAVIVVGSGVCLRDVVLFAVVLLCHTRLKGEKKAEEEEEEEEEKEEEEAVIEYNGRRGILRNANINILLCLQSKFVLCCHC
jgi:hypothetical protein